MITGTATVSLVKFFACMFVLATFFCSKYSLKADTVLIPDQGSIDFCCEVD